MEAAARLVERHGADGLTMPALAKATGLSRATLYRRTGGRAPLLDALAAGGTPVGDRAGARERILAAARVVFGRAGFESATVVEIAAEAKVGLATVYRTFKDRDGLILAFLDSLAPRRAARDIAAHASADLRADLERLAEQMLRGLHDDAPLMRLMLLELLRGGPLLPRLRAMSPTRSLPSIARLLAGHAKAGRLPPTDATQLAQAFGGIVLAFGVLGPLLNGQPRGDPATTARAITDLFLRGALAPPRRRRPAKVSP
jgi:AcrR family transcriptional regulator